MSWVIDYDEGGYCYENYWLGREYEHQADLIALNALMQPEPDGWIADFGSGFGRLATAYLGTGRPVVLVDYSSGLLGRAKARLGPPGPNRQYVAAELSHLPFRSESVSTSILVRVMHHLVSFDQVLREVSRVSQGEWILDVPQKLHAAAWVRALRRRSWRMLCEEAPVNLSRRQGAVFLNYHPKSILRQTDRLGWSIRSALSVSNFRLAWLKRWAGTRRLVALEQVSQRALATVRFGPSWWLSLSREGVWPRISDWRELFACPACGHALPVIDGGETICQGCGEHFFLHDGIWDFRWPRPTAR